MPESARPHPSGLADRATVRWNGGGLGRSRRLSPPPELLRLERDRD